MKTSIRSFIIILFILLPNILVTSLLYGGQEITAEDCKTCDIDCLKRYEPASAYGLVDGGIKKRIMIFFDSENAAAQNSDIVVFLREGSKCRVVLGGGGSSAFFEKKAKKNYPDIITSWHMGASGGIQTRYVWNGKKYEDIVRKANIEKGKKLNDKALYLCSQKKIEAAITIWREIDEKLHTADTEVLNNLGFAYYELAKKTKNYHHYDKAEDYFDRVLRRHPKSWAALLNMGNLEYDMNDFVFAIEHYDELLKIKPDYEYAERIKKRIDELKSKPEQIGLEIIALRHPSGQKNITYVRIDNKNVIRQGYYPSGKMRFRENIVDGYGNGEYKSWFESGQPSVVGQQKMGKGIGKYLYYDPRGAISQVLIYKEEGSSVDVTNEYKK